MVQRTTSSSPTQSGAVLIIDDDVDLVDEMVGIIKRGHKMNAHAAHSSAGAIRYLDELESDGELPRVIFLDLHMEDDFSGFRVLRHVRRDSRLRRTPIIVISHSEDLNHVKEAYRFGATSFVNKPYDVRELHSVLEMVTEYWCELNIKVEPERNFETASRRRLVRTTTEGDAVEFARLPNLAGYMRKAKLSASRLARLSGVALSAVTAAARGEVIRTRDIHKILRTIVPRLSGNVDLTKEIIPGGQPN